MLVCCRRADARADASEAGRQSGRGRGSQRSCGRQTQRNALDSGWVANRIKWCNYGQVLARSRSRPAANIIKKPLAQIDNGPSQPWDGQRKGGGGGGSLLLRSMWARRLSLSDLLGGFFSFPPLFCWCWGFSLFLAFYFAAPLNATDGWRRHKL